jgi:hypothetical protein
MIYPQDADVANPAAGDPRSEGDDHIRGIKVMLKKLVYEQVGTITASGAASVNTYSSIGTFVAGYDYILVGDSVYGSAVTGLTARPIVSGSPVSANLISSYHGANGGVASVGSTSAIAITGGLSIGDSSTETSRLEVTAYNPMGTANPRHFSFSCGGVQNGGTTTQSMSGDGVYQSASQVEGIQILPSSGTITGVFKLYRRFRPA